MRSASPRGGPQRAAEERGVREGDSRVSGVKGGGCSERKEGEREREGYRLQWCPAAWVSCLLLAPALRALSGGSSNSDIRGGLRRGVGAGREREGGRAGGGGRGAARRWLAGLGWAGLGEHCAPAAVTGQSARRRRRLRASCYNLRPSSPPAQEGGQDVSPTRGERRTAPGVQKKEDASRRQGKRLGKPGGADGVGGPREPRPPSWPPLRMRAGPMLPAAAERGPRSVRPGGPGAWGGQARSAGVGLKLIWRAPPWSAAISRVAAERPGREQG